MFGRNILCRIGVASCAVVRWLKEIVVYHCPHCVQEKLVPAKRLRWYEYLLMLVLLRPWKCPHCFERYVRGII